MNKPSPLQAGNENQAGPSHPTVVVRHRARTLLPIAIPKPREFSPLPGETAKFRENPHMELQRVQERFSGTTPQEREIFRKLGFKMEQLLKERRRNRSQHSDEADGGAWETVSDPA